MIRVMTLSRPHISPSRIDTALAHLAGGDSARAEALLKAILAEDSHCAGAWHGLACVARETGQPRTAIAMVAHALTLTGDDSEKARFHLTLAAALDEAGHFREAVSACRVAVLLEPRDFRAKAFLSELYYRDGKIQESVQEFDEAIRLAADPVPLMMRRGMFLMERRAYSDACPVFSSLVAHLPDRAEAHANFGTACFEAGRMSDALTALQRAIALDAPTAQTLNTLGLVYQALGALDHASDAFDRALAQAPDDTGIMSNRAMLRAETGHVMEAETVFRDIMQSVAGQGENSRGAGDPVVRDRQYHQARFNLATIQLAQGAFAEGWDNFESRLFLLGQPTPEASWQGEATDEPVCVRAEQGLGDCLQFLRFVPLAALRAPLILVIPTVLHPLLAFMPRLAALMRSGRVRLEGEAKLACSLLSLPRLLQISTIDPSPILDLGMKVEKGRIGLFRAGNPAYRFNARRSLPATMLTPLLDTTECRFVNFQLGDAPACMEQGVGNTLLDTARAMARCELVIGVDTMLAHLAGSCGVPLWLLDRQGGDWRWQGPDWYEALRVFRPDDHCPPEQAWPPVIARVSEALRQHIAQSP